MVLLVACGSDASFESDMAAEENAQRLTTKSIEDGSIIRESLHSVVSLPGPTETRVQWNRDGTRIFFSHLSSVFSTGPDGADLVFHRTAPDRREYVPGAGSRLGTSFDVSMQSDRIVVPVSSGERSPRGVRGDGYAIAAVDVSDAAGWEVEVNSAGQYFDFFPRWSPDEAMVAFIREASDGFRLVVSGSNVSYGLPIVESPPVLKRHSVRQIPVWEPSGEAIAFVGSYDYPNRNTELHTDALIFMVAPDGTNLRRLTATVSPPAWSPNGARIAFAKPEQDEVWLYTMAANGSDHRQVTAIDDWRLSVSGQDWLGHNDPRPAEAWIKLMAWSPDGSMILYSCGTAVCVVTPDGKWVGRSPNRLRRPLAPQGERWVVLSRAEVSAAWAPDSSRIAVGLQQEPTMNLRHDVMLYTMSPDGEDLQVLVRGGRRVGESRLEEPLRPAGPVPRLVPKNAYGCSSGHAVPDPTSNPGLVQDCETLLSLRDVLAGTAELAWSGHRPMTEWDGLVVAGSPPRVEELNLARRALTGTIPKTLWELAKLRKLDLQSNLLSGEIPMELGRLRDLISLDLSFNLLDGEIPKWLGSLSKLESLELAFNGFSGSIPDTLAQLSELRELDLRSNQLSGQIPAELTALGNLEYLMLYGNRLTGCVPAGLPIDRELLGLPDCESIGRVH